VWQRWEEMFPNCSWIQQIRTGAVIKLTRPRSQIRFKGRAMRMNPDPEVAARNRAVILQMLAKNILRPMTATELQTAMLHPFFWREKNHVLGKLPYNGSILQACDNSDFEAVNLNLKAWRFIVDFKRGLNQWIPSIHFRANGLSEAMVLVERDDMTSYLDTSEAYYNDMIAAEHQTLLAMHVHDPVLLLQAPHGVCFRTLCFGYRDAPRQYIRKQRLPLEWVRSCGIRVADVMDDLLVLSHKILGEDPQANNLRHLMVLCLVMDFLRYRLQLDKKGFVPSESRAFAGAHIFTTLLWIDLTPQKWEKHVSKLLKMIDTVTSRQSSGCHALATPRELLSVANTVTSSRQMISHPKLHMTHTRFLIATAQRRRVGWDQWIPVPPSVTTEWAHVCSTEFKFWRGKRFNLGPPDWIIAGDASSRMLGGCVINKQTMLPDPAFQPISMLMPNQINGVPLWDGHSTKTEPAARILLCYMFALQLNWTTGLLLYLGDNTTSEAVTNNEGGRVHAINLIMEPFEPFFRARRITCRQAYTPGDHLIKIGVDGLSRTGKLSRGMTEIVVKQWVFQALTEHLAPALDLCATHDNTKCNTFWARYPTPTAQRANVLTQPLDQLPLLSYAFPPVKLVQTLLQKFRDEAPMNSQLLIIVPFWRSQNWFPLLLRLISSTPTLIPLDLQHFGHPLSHKELTKGWYAISTVLSKNPAVTQAYRQRLLRESHKVSATALVRCISTPYAHSSTFNSTRDELGTVLTRLTLSTT